MDIDFSPLRPLPLPGYRSPRRRWYRSLGRGPWLWFDGRFVAEQDACFTVDQLLSAGLNSVAIDGVAYGTQLRLGHFLWEELQREAHEVGLPFPAGMSYEAIKRAVTDLLNKNRYFGLVHLQFTLLMQFVTDSSETLLPLPSLMITSRLAGGTIYSEDVPSCALASYGRQRRGMGTLGGIRTLFDPLLYQGYRLMRLRALDECLVYNTSSRVSGGLRSVLYVTDPEGKRVFTPSHEEGAYYDPIVAVMPEVFSAMGLRGVESTQVSVSDLERAKYIFIASSVSGLRSVSAVDELRYMTCSVGPGRRRLNHLLFPDIVYGHTMG